MRFLKRIKEIMGNSHTHETKKRSIVKAITMKIIEIVSSIVVLQFLFGIPFISLGLPFVLEGIQLVEFIIHEQAWSNIHWGLKIEDCEKCHFKAFHEKTESEGKLHD